LHFGCLNILGEITSDPSQVYCPQVGADRVRSKIPDQTGRATYLKAATWLACLRRFSFTGDEFFDKFAGSGFIELSVGEINQADDNRSRRSYRFLISAHHVWGGRISGREELRLRSAASCDQTISKKICVTDLFW